MADDIDEMMASFERPAELPEAAPQNEVLQVLARGVAATTFAALFGMSKEQVQMKLSGAAVVGKTRLGGPAYEFREACSRLARPGPDQVIEYVKKMRPNDLPPIMQTAFWDAALKRQKFEREAGDLWRTEEIEMVLAEVFKNFRMGALLFADTLARETGLTPQQRKIVEELSDTLLAEARKSLLENDAFAKIRNMREINDDLIGHVELPEVDEPDDATIDAANADRKPRRRS